MNSNIKVGNAKNGKLPITCVKCGATEEYPTPSEVASFRYITAEFGAKHRECEAK